MSSNASFIAEAKCDLAVMTMKFTSAYFFINYRTRIMQVNVERVQGRVLVSEVLGLLMDMIQLLRIILVFALEMHLH